MVLAIVKAIAIAMARHPWVKCMEIKEIMEVACQSIEWRLKE